MTLRLALIAALLVGFGSAAFGQTLCFNMDTSVPPKVVGGGNGMVLSAANDCSQYDQTQHPTKINTANPSDPNYAAWQTWQAKQTAIANKTKAAVTVQNALTAGITLTCTATATNNMSGTYVVTPDLVTYLLSAQFFTGAQLQTIAITDTAGVDHYFKSSGAATTITTIILGYFNNLFSYQQQIDAGKTATLPPNTSSAC